MLVSASAPATDASRQEPCSGRGNLIVANRVVRLLVLPKSDPHRHYHRTQFAPAPIGVCRLPTGNPVLLDDALAASIPRGVPLNGQYVSWASRTLGGTGTWQYEQDLLNIATVTSAGTQLVHQFPLFYIDPRTFPQRQYDLGLVVDLVLAPDGSPGWIGCKRTRGEELHQGSRHRKGIYPIRGNPRGPSCQSGVVASVYILDPKAQFGYRKLDAGKGIDSRYLRLRGNVMTWLHDGQLRTAQL